MTIPIRKCDAPELDRIYASHELRLEDGTAWPVKVFIPREEGDLLYSICRALTPDLTLEVGMANGFSTAFIARALRDNGRGAHIAIDPFQRSEWRSAGLQLLRSLGLLERVRLVELPSHQALPMLEAEGVRADFIFIDGSHLFDYALGDFLCSDRLLKTGGLIAFDDSDWPAIRQVLRFVVANRHYEVALPEVVIEGERYTPSVASRLLRAIGRRIPRLDSKLRPSFTTPDVDLGLRGRCVVLRKLAPDDRNDQARGSHRSF
jgi:predicted O-methyltransferase YrrM